MHQNSNQFDMEECNHTKLTLKFGNTGWYQYFIYFIVLLTWLHSGMCLGGISFLFMNPGFDCESFGVSEFQCENYVCSNIPQSNWHLLEKKKQFETLVTEFGPFHCAENFQVSVMRALINFGNAVGVLLLVFFADNGGERKAFLSSLFFMLFGSLMLSVSNSIEMACTSLFVLGLGLFAGMKIGISIISQITEDNLGAKMIGTILAGYTLGGFIIAQMYGLTHDWRSATFFCYFLPIIFLLLASYFIMQDTPKTLLREKSPTQACQILNWISFVNNQGQPFTESQVKRFIEEEKLVQEVKSSVTPFDLIRFRSLRIPSIMFFIMVPLSEIIYFSHMINIQEFGFNPVLNQFLITISEIMSIILIPFTISFARRKLLSIICTFTCFLLSIGTGLIELPSSCQFCSIVVFQMSLIMITRFLLNYQICLFQTLITEFYPTSIKSIGVGVSSFMGAVGSGISQIIMINNQQVGFNPFYLTGVVFLLMFVFSFFVPETLRLQKTTQIREVEQELKYKKRENCL